MGYPLDNPVLNDVQQERYRQVDLWGQQDHDAQTWLSILVEEVGEVAKECAEGIGSAAGRRFDMGAYRAEMIQVAAVAVAAVEALDRHRRLTGT